MRLWKLTKKFGSDDNPDRLFKIVYNLGQVSFLDWAEEREREIYFSAILQERVGHHLFGEKMGKYA